MTETLDHPGPSIPQLRGAAWTLGFGAAVAWISLVVDLGRRRPWDAPSGFMLAAGVTWTVAAACGAVLVAIESAEARTRDAGGVPSR